MWLCMLGVSPWQRRKRRVRCQKQRALPRARPRVCLSLKSFKTALRADGNPPFQSEAQPLRVWDLPAAGRAASVQPQAVLANQSARFSCHVNITDTGYTYNHTNWTAAALSQLIAVL